MYRAFLPSPALDAGRRSLRLRCTAATTTIACLRHPAVPPRPFSSTSASQAPAKAQPRRPRHWAGAKRGPPQASTAPEEVKPRRAPAAPKKGKPRQPPPIAAAIEHGVEGLDPERFPAFPESLFAEQAAQVEVGFHEMCKALDMRLKLTKDYSNPSKGQHRCSISLQIGNHISERSKAVALTKDAATKRAFDLLLSRLLHNGALSEIQTALEEIAPSEPKVEHEDAYMQNKSDVYNFCAGFGLVPQFTYTRQKLRHVRLKGKKTVIKVTIDVPELGIKAISASTDPAAADTTACQKFKAEVEEKTKAGTLKTTDQADFKGLSVSTAQDFFRFYRQKTRLYTNLDLSFTGDYNKMSGMTRSTIQVNGTVCDATVVMKARSNVEKLANLVAAVQLARDQPQLMPDFQEALEQGGGRVRNEVPPIDIDLHDSAVASMWKNSWHPRAVAEDKNAGPAPEEFDRRPFDRQRMLPGARKKDLSATLKQGLEHFRTAAEFRDLREQLASLPMSQYRDKVLAMVQDPGSPYSIVVGATGSGKTTQVPQLLLNDAIASGHGADCNIICTQPRRIAATSVARRVAVERGETVGQSVGYQVRFDASRPRPNGGITFCTTGILLEQLKADPDGVFEWASHILVDEVHERDLPIDFLMTVLKKAVADRQARGLRVPKIVLMSATLDTELFANYLSTKDSQGTKVIPAPSISVPGRTFPVESRFLDEIMSDLNQNHGRVMKSISARDPKLRQYLDSELQMQRGPPRAVANTQPTDAAPAVDWSNKISTPDDDTSAEDKLEAIVPVAIVAATIARIAETTESGAILAFLPGLQEIQDTQKELLLDDFKRGFSDPDKFRICLLHSSVPREDQAAAFDIPPAGCRKIILSTNIAETSVTVPDVQHVVDTGKLREKRYDQLTRISGLQVVWESKSNAKQRAGRAGRVQNGFYHALFARERHERMPAVGLPELLRSDLQETILAIKKQRFQQRAAEFLGEFIEPPSRAAVDAAVEHLTRLKALTGDEQLTPLGRLLAELPVHPSLGKMIVMGVIFRCLDPLIIIGAAASERPLFVLPLNARAEARACHRAYGGMGSDHLTMLKAYNSLRSVKFEYGDRMAQDHAFGKFLHWGAFNTIHKTAQSIVDVLVESGLAPKAEMESPSSAGFHDWRGRRRGPISQAKLLYGHPSLNTNSDNTELVRGLIAAGLYPNLACNLRSRMFASASEDQIILHPSSENATNSVWPRGTLVAFGQLQRAAGSETLFARDTTVVQPLTSFLLADSVEFTEGTPKLGGWLPFFVRNTPEFEEKPNWQGGRDALNGLMRFKTSLDQMLDRAYSDLRVLQRERASSHTNAVSPQPGGAYTPENSRRMQIKFLPSQPPPNQTFLGQKQTASQDLMLNRLPKAIVEILSLQPPTTTRPPRRRSEAELAARSSAEPEAVTRRRGRKISREITLG